MAEPLYVLWDESHLWGLLLVRALTHFSIPFRLVRAREITTGLLLVDPPQLLVVPGGFAKKKAEALGRTGLEAIRAFVASGGNYLGFCGGAGLALSDPGGLGLCPWSRKPFANRLQHFASGHVQACPDCDHELSPPDGPTFPLVPVWWPARFQQKNTAPDVDIVATYGKPGPDFMMADVVLSSLPEDTLTDWENQYGVTLSPAFLDKTPLVIHGHFGQGRYLLSYAHLETPGSCEANAWLFHLLERMAGIPQPGIRACVPEWKLCEPATAWPDPILTTNFKRLDETLRMGLAHSLFFWRNGWLLGWRLGLPGAGINGLYALLHETLAVSPTAATLTYWQREKEDFDQKMRLFCEGLQGYLLAESLAMTMHRADPTAVPASILKAKRRELFGPPPGAPSTETGMADELVGCLEELFWLAARE
ncbi:BPL-N domain-containing protein [Desulfovibrio inopinatus]|uniref:BPL-N domain-containing protein n=1 Tax=Desulfovibrio inopinatus TaxID=102109 RepID=UPI000426AD65|nr:BPL-N domain-containing protein [Desulfovibrio inopinatus]